MKQTGKFLAMFILGVSLLAAAFHPVSEAHAEEQGGGGAIVVTRTDDPTPDGCAVNGCSLREAVMAANAAIGPDQIGLTVNALYTLSIPADTYNDANTGDLNITDSVNFIYPNTVCIFGGCVATIKGGASFLDRIFRLQMNAQVRMYGMTVEYGSTSDSGGGILINSGSSLELVNSTIYHNAADVSGGGIYNNGYLTLDNSFVMHNYSADGAGIYNETDAALFVNSPSYIYENTIVGNGDGGGLWMANPANTEISNLWVQHNHADAGYGGGIYYASSSTKLTFTHSHVTDNTAMFGAGIYLDGGKLSVDTSTISGNAATNTGGGIGATTGSASFVISNSTISANTANDGGGIGLEWYSSTTFTLTNVTVSGNSAIDSGGGLMLGESPSWLFNVTVTNNSSDSDHNGVGGGGGINISYMVYIANSILGGDPRGGDCVAISEGSIQSLDYNLIQVPNIGNGANACPITGATFHNKIGVAPMLAPLADNGGETLTHSFLPGSPLQEAGNPYGCKGAKGILLTTDQRGMLRPVGMCDIGALEYQVDLFLPLLRR